MRITKIIENNPRAVKVACVLTTIVTSYAVIKNQPIEAIETGIEYISQAFNNINLVGSAQAANDTAANTDGDDTCYAGTSSAAVLTTLVGYQRVARKRN
ncbi:hypothetical protein HN924_00765 [Candidatus Woesearchaeota archaeon]|jgi:hypothetical protein|nr:hypothetical protein [Candidatus Woesearchaeota archaeon]MBT7062485.1 hypothetical protein [Candidatus Woesearchaeota archaeon]MBT7402918.1 hypothetical protein [Candidatus Woesearchaeota archaeon]